MTSEAATVIAEMIESYWQIPYDETKRHHWVQLLMAYPDTEMKQVIDAIAALANTHQYPPKVYDLREAIKIQKRKSVPDESWREQPAERPQPPPWVLGWAIARFRDRDFRLWIEQKSGMDVLDRDWRKSGAEGPSGNEWAVELADRGLMLQDDRERYIEEGKSLSMDAFWALVRGIVRDPA